MYVLFMASCFRIWLIRLLNSLGVSIKTTINPDFMHPIDNFEIVGSPYKIETELGWKPEIKLDDTLHDMIGAQNFLNRRNLVSVYE